MPSPKTNGAAPPTRLPLPERLSQAGRALVGTFLYLHEPEIVRALARIGHNSVIIDRDETIAAYWHTVEGA